MNKTVCIAKDTKAPHFLFYLNRNRNSQIFFVNQKTSMHKSKTQQVLILSRYWLANGNTL